MFLALVPTPAHPRAACGPQHGVAGRAHLPAAAPSAYATAIDPPPSPSGTGARLGTSVDAGYSSCAKIRIIPITDTNHTPVRTQGMPAMYTAA